MKILDSSEAGRPDVFDKTSLGYLVMESQYLVEWRTLLQDGIGLHLGESESDLMTFRADGHESRIIIQCGVAEDLVSVGWEVNDHQTLDEILSRLRAYEIEYTEGLPKIARQRGVKGFWAFRGPKDITIELYVDPVPSQEPLTMMNPGIITGTCGLGHIAITSRRPTLMRQFWEDIFDLRHSDTILERIAGVDVNIDFFRANARHHSIAIAKVMPLPVDPIRTKIQHFNLLTITLEGLYEAFRRCRKLGFGTLRCSVNSTRGSPGLDKG
jgi:Glyoxalase/Bleomycin resistance protein/Dioxygenase superfamily